MIPWIEVTPKQVRAAQLQVAVLRRAGVDPDPLVAAIADAETHTLKEIAELERAERGRGATDERSPGEDRDRSLRPYSSGHPGPTPRRKPPGIEPTSL
jgi:hypothetical protein